MFSHRFSLIGYVLIVLSIASLIYAFSATGLFVIQMLVPYLIPIGLTLVVVGVIARGFERVEAAIRASNTKA